MIKEIYKSSPKRYGNYFLSTEADDEQPSERKFNTKVIDVKPDNRRRINYTDGAEEVDEIEEEDPSEEVTDDEEDIDYTQDPDNPETTDEENNDESNDDNTEPEVIDGDNPDANNDGGDSDNNSNPDQTATDTEPQVTDNGVEVNNDQTDPNNAPAVDEDNTDYTADGENNDTNTEDGEVESIEDDNTDYTDGADGEDGQEAPADDQQPEEAKKGPGLEYDSTRKYNLFENYLSLTNAIENYISKLENTMGADYNENQVIKTVTTKLREIHDLCYEYMTLKFEISTYVQSLLFYQNLVIMVQFTFNLLEKSRKVVNKNKNK